MHKLPNGSIACPLRTEPFMVFAITAPVVYANVGNVKDTMPIETSYIVKAVLHLTFGHDSTAVFCHEPALLEFMRYANATVSK